MRKALLLSICLVFCFVLAGCGTDVAVTPTSDAPPSSSDSSPDPGTTNTFVVGEKAAVRDKSGSELYTFVINSVTQTDARNQFMEKDPAQVVVINYTYENIAMDEDIRVSSLNFKIIDAGGNVCETYPVSTSAYAQGTPMGAKCTAEEAYGLIEEGQFKLLFYDNMFNSKADATFTLSVE
ncbi:MAG: DUF4352 domain-containing protein [Peptococcaceae bacterium]|nr:DUF4352 domain-containing protein [Peptococcaceae bacterium]